MARPKKNNADYFSHDNNMRSDTKIQAVRAKFGNEGYAVWNMLLEVLAECDNFKLSLKNGTQWEILAGDFRVDTEKLKEIIAYFIKLELIIKDGTNLVCPNLSKRLEPLLEIREKKREWRENKEKGVKDGTNGIKDIPNPICPNLNALKESKVKESKDISEQSSPSSLLLNGKKPRTPRDFANAWRATLGKPPIEKKKLTPKQEIFMIIDRIAHYWLEAVKNKTGTKIRFDAKEGGKNYNVARKALGFLTEEGAKKQIDFYLYSEKYEEHGDNFATALSEHTTNTILLKQK